MHAFGRSMPAVAIAVALVTPAAPVAQASESATDRKAKKKAKRFEKKGKKAYKAKRWDDAIAAFELAYDTHPEPRYLFNIGRAYEKAGELHKAMEYVLRYVVQVEDEEEKEDGQDVYDILAKRLRKTSGEVKLGSEPTDAVVEIVGEERTIRGRTPMHQWLPAGTWRLTVGMTGHERHESNLAVGVGETVKLEVTLRTLEEVAAARAAEETAEEAAQADSEPEAVASPPPRAAAASPDRTWAWVALGTGAALLAAGAAFGVRSSQAGDELRGFKDNPGSGTEAEFDDAKDRADAHSTTANILYGVGGAAAAAGLVLWWTW